MSPRTLNRIMDWCFAPVFAIAAGFLLKCASMLLGQTEEVQLDVGGWSYRGPLYACWPLMGLGLAAVAASAFHLAGAFREGKSLGEAIRERRRIRSESGRRRGD